MTFYMKQIAAAACGILLLVGSVHAQIAPSVDRMDVDVVIELDPLGDANVSYAMTMTAKQWQAWKQMYGGNPSLLRRDMGKLVSQYATEDFDLEQNEMERKMQLSLRGRGVSRHLGGGRYELELEPEMRTGDIIDGGREVRFDYLQDNGPGSVMMMDQIIKLPEGVRDVEQRTDSAGRPVLAYEVDVDDGSPGVALLVIGIVSLLAGLALLPLAFVGKSSHEVAVDAEAA